MHFVIRDWTINRLEKAYRGVMAMLAITAMLFAQADIAQAATAKPKTPQQPRLEAVFDSTFGTTKRALPPVQAAAPAPVRQPSRAPFLTPVSLPAPQPYANYQDPFQAQLAQLTNAEMGRIGVAAYDLTTGQTVAVLGDQPFPMASTSKVAIVATFLEQVDAGRFKLTDQFPLMVPVASRKFDGPVAPVRPGMMVSAQGLIEAALIRSDNPSTDALLAAVGGPPAVNDWLKRARLDGVRLDRDIATLVRDDGAVNPAAFIDERDSATPRAMVRMLAGFHQGRWLSQSSRDLLLSTMARCETGKQRIPQLLPEGLVVAHKTGTLSNTSSDIGIISTADGHSIALAIYVTGQGGKQNRDARIASIARTIYDNYRYNAQSSRRTAVRK
jgi:beta-lactamase class A